MIRLLYTLTGIAVSPLLHLWLARRAHRGKEDKSRLGERFGHASVPRPPGRLIWLHAASVGEAQSVLTLVRTLLAQHGGLSFLITTGTVTSAALVAQQSLPRTVHHYVPVDTPFAVARFLKYWQPDLALWVESELWPQLLFQSHARHIPLLLINARMSAHSAKGWAKWPRTIRRLLGLFTTIYAGSAEDAKRFTALGARDVRDVGNLKYDAAPLPIDAGLLAELSRQCGTRPVWVAASTHANEEQLSAEAHRQLRAHFPDALCILIPRHATRGNALAAELRSLGYRVAQRSAGEPVTAETELYLADTMGEVGSFYRLADIVFLGGSLVATGGHNPLEPARLSCALITGTHVHNFATIMNHLISQDALCMVENKDALATTLMALLNDDQRRLTLAQNALAVAEDSRGASELIVQHIALLLEPRA